MIPRGARLPRTRMTCLLLVGLCAALPAAGQPEVRQLEGKRPDTRVTCTVYPPSQASRPGAGLVIHLYGSGGSSKVYNVGRPPYDRLRKALADRGLWIVVPELGPRHWMNQAACDAVDAVIDAMVAGEGVDPTRVHLLGTSMGAGSSLLYVMRRPGKVRSVCSIFPMTDFEQWVKERPGYLKPLSLTHGFPPEDSAAALRELSPKRHPEAFRRTGVFLVHGLEDATVPAHHSREFADLLRRQGSPVVHREVPGMGHRDLIVEPFQEEIADFFTGVSTAAPLPGKVPGP